eukprot:NODE_3032_length_840_cov_178.081529.p1 GENE.NODE_3032_length_840_cov_178.081529~~NODE_3032_length_840_cov_178.081529.p1  ORF type:complete len:236 (-),score=48.16 NODE_3032_length_840_cov_178.081529:74-781(-)
MGLPKHAHPEYVRQKWANETQFEDVFVIFMLRNPFSALESMNVHPYAFRKCFQIKNWQRRLCNCSLLKASRASDHLCADGQEYYSSPVDIWNTYVRGYERLHELQPNRSIVVQYEALVLKPRKILANISAWLGIPADPNFVGNISDPADTHGENRSSAVKKIQDRSYLDAFSQDQLLDICELVERGHEYTNEIEETCANVSYEEASANVSHEEASANVSHVDWLPPPPFRSPWQP